MKKTAPPQNKLRKTNNVEWCVISVKNAFPHLRSCVACGKRAQLRQTVLLLPLFLNGELRSTCVIHRKCVADILDRVPLDPGDYERIFHRVRRKFREEPDNNS